MKVLIIEDEIYLAQSISHKLEQNGNECTILPSVEAALETDWADLILVSTKFAKIDLLIEQFEGAIIVLLITHIDSATTLEYLQMGASDYIIKPVLVDELMRKINHLVEFKRLKSLNESYEHYMRRSINIRLPKVAYNELKFPLLIRTNSRKMVDFLVFDIVWNLKFGLKIASLTEIDWENSIRKSDKILSYFKNFDYLRVFEKERLSYILRGNLAILTTTDKRANFGFETLDLIYNENENCEILTIEEYIKQTILNYQDRMSDTKIADHLGVSRKSIWEKRKKHEIVKVRKPKK